MPPARRAKPLIDPARIPVWLGRRARIAALPVGVSLAIHLLLLALVATVTWTVVVARPGPPLAGEVVIDLADPAIAPVNAIAMPDVPETPAPISPAIEPAPPRKTVAPGVSRPPPRVAPAQRQPVVMEPLRRRGGISFAGVSADRAASVVYVVDTSGAMASSYGLIVDELERSLSRLDPTQLFQVVSFRDRSFIDPEDTARATLIAGDGGLVDASPRHRASVVRELRESVTPSGRSDPAPALALALRLNPDAIFLLTRSIRRTGPGQDDDQPPPEGPPPPWSEPWRDALLSRLDALNPRGPQGRHTLIKAIQFLDHDPTGTLQTIGARHGGDAGYVVRSPADLVELTKAPPPMHVQIKERVDRARVYLDELAARGLDWQVLFAYPSDRGRETVVRGAQRAIEELGLAASSIDASAQLHLARSAILLAGASGDESRVGEAVQIVRTALAKLDDALDERVIWHRDHLRILFVPHDPQSDPDLVPPPFPEWGGRDLQIEHVLAGVRSAPLGGFPAACGRALATIESPPITPTSETSDASLVVMAIDAMTRRAMQLSRASSPPDPAWVRFAIAQILQLRTHEALALDREQRETLILDRIDRLLDDAADLRELQPEATLAMARRRLAGDDPRSAEGLLREILVRDDADHLAPPALIALADLLLRDRRVIRRAQGPMMLMTLHEGWPEAPETVGVVQRALFFSRDVLRSAGPSERTIALNHYHQILRDAEKIEDLENEEYWLAQHDSVLLELARLHDSNFSLHLLEQIRPGSPEGPPAVAMYRPLVRDAITRMHELHRATRGVPGREEDAEVSLEAAERHARNALALYRAHGVVEDTAIERASLATTYELMGLPARQIEALEALLPYADQLEGGAPGVRIRIARIERNLGDDASAFARLRQLTESVQPADEAFWHAWAMLLEILRNQNASGERTGTILAHIAMLRTLDEGLGGKPWRSRIDAVASSLTP